MHHVVLFSGGMDSTTALNHVVKKSGPENVTALSIAYGSVHNAAEMKAAKKVAKYLGVELEQVILPQMIFRGAGSVLMGEGEIPNEAYRRSGPQPTVVPFRNGTFLSVAAAVGFRYDTAEIWIAAHADDAEDWAYPDCTPDFLEAMAEAIHIASMGNVRLIAPFQYMTKSAIVDQAYHEDAPLHLSYSCYRGGSTHCGQCATCLDRHKAFINAGFEDPTTYEKPLQNVPYSRRWDID